MSLLHTPDGRYFIVRGRLWRATNPALAPELRAALVHDLMNARRAVKEAKRSGDAERLKAARAAVHAAKLALGERGPPWWTDSAPDFNRHLVKIRLMLRGIARGIRPKRPLPAQRAERTRLLEHSR